MILIEQLTDSKERESSQKSMYDCMLGALEQKDEKNETAQKHENMHLKMKYEISLAELKKENEIGLRSLKERVVKLESEKEEAWREADLVRESFQKKIVSLEHSLKERSLQVRELDFIIRQSEEKSEKIDIELGSRLRQTEAHLEVVQEQLKVSEHELIDERHKMRLEIKDLSEKLTQQEKKGCN